MHHPKLEDVVRRDPRYAIEAYEFIYAALTHTQQTLGILPPEEDPEQEAHISGQQLMHGARDLALQEFGFLARTVFRFWGINQTDDFGEIVFNLIEAGLMNKTPQDSKADFHAVYDLDEALQRQYHIDFPRDS